MVKSPNNTTNSVSEAERSTKPEGGTRRWLHVLVAAVAASILIALIAIIPKATQHMRSRQQYAIRQAVHVDLKMMKDKQDAFFNAYGFYTTDLNAIGIAPKLLLYKIGFVQASSHEHHLYPERARELNIRPEIKDVDALLAAVPDLKIQFSPLTKLDSIDISRLGSYCADCTATPETFKAIVAANLDSDAELDIWTINEKGEIEHVVKDAAGK